MSRNSKKRRPTAYKWIGHIEVYFNDEEREHIIAYWADRNFDFVDALSTLTQTLTGVKITYNTSGDGYRCSLQPKDQDSTYYGHTVGFSHAELPRLLQIAIYVQTVLMENQAIDKPEKESMPDW